MTRLSIVTPAFNEQEAIASFYREVRSVVEPLSCAWEIIFVDDGSTDATANCVRELRRADSRVRLVRLTRNFGNQAALLAGIRAAAGDAILTLDCDLQHPPAEIPRMVEAWRRGARVVQMVRSHNPGAGFLERATSRLFHRLLRWLTGLPLRYGVGDFRLLDRQAAAMIIQLIDTHPFHRGLVEWLGLPVTYLEYAAARRAQGRPQLRFSKRVALSLDAIAALSIRPLRLAFWLGLSAVALSLVYALVVLVAYFLGHTVPGYSTIIFTVVFLGAVQLITMGALGEYIGRIHEQTRRLPPYIVAEEDPAELPAPELANLPRQSTNPTPAAETADKITPQPKNEG